MNILYVNNHVSKHGPLSLNVKWEEASCVEENILPYKIFCNQMLNNTIALKMWAEYDLPLSSRCSANIVLTTSRIWFRVCRCSTVVPGNTWH